MRGSAVRRMAMLAGLGVLAALTLLAKGEADARRAAWPAEADTLFLPTAGVLRVLSFGHHEMAADLCAARTNVYFGTQITQHGKQRWLENYLDTVVRLDPRFHRMYESAAVMLVYSGRRITVDAVQAANGFLERGMVAFPDDRELRFQHGFNHWFEMPNASPGDARIPAWKDKGIRSLEIAAQFADAPYYLPSLVARLRAEQGQIELAIRGLERAYAVTSSEEAREQIRRKLVELRGKRNVEELEEGWHDLQARVKQCPAYFPEGLCLLMGPLADADARSP